ncbi:hypothetical protein [Pseudolactococcus paracarnosus]|uniref:Uncharacterized protein n=1 Tax=Pseudolactococcus paracarnosus TaxID=2749962 RepID=A0A7L4WIC3_9LACT|nr:hypothetical protein [Lactococcus paracarnosus]SPC37134.1 membrane hypothetical protein [Lactococcus piscium]MCJ1978094.1 hypothetical protein [Lactococcus paracarnosus]MCJ1984237.1 hypothetical protein [Lactococcus paracarnosus]MCJ1994669.1 hypothetical protein [Lactococcus paracarnosus]MCJ1997950.1 hypothetical protein [Lactococcus paracarnosus]
MENLYYTKKLIFVELLFALALSIAFILMDTSKRFLEQNPNFNGLVAKTLAGGTGYLLGDFIRILIIVGGILLIGTMIFSLSFIVNQFQIRYILSQNDIQIMAFLALTPKEIFRHIFLKKIKSILNTFLIIILFIFSSYSLLYYLVFPINIQKIASHNYDVLLMLFVAYLLISITIYLTSVIIKIKIRKRDFILS